MVLNGTSTRILYQFDQFSDHTDSEIGQAVWTRNQGHLLATTLKNKYKKKTS